MSNSVELNFHWTTKDSVQTEVRANVVFIHAKLVAGGMDVTEARIAVEKLFSAGQHEGYKAGFEVGRDCELGDDRNFNE